MKFPLPLLSVAAGLLAACAALAPQPDEAATPPPEGADAAMRYVCDDGSIVDAYYPTTDAARIIHDGRTIDMRIARSASGARYVGGGWEWWTKGMTEGRLTRLKPGEEIASEPGVGCVVVPQAPADGVAAPERSS